MKYFVLGIYSDVEPMLSEEFDNKEDRDIEAIQWKQDNTTDGGGIYRLDIDDKGIPTCESYGYQELNPDEEPELNSAGFDSEENNHFKPNKL